jgi:hypothetical protein
MPHPTRASPAHISKRFASPHARRRVCAPAFAASAFLRRFIPLSGRGDGFVLPSAAGASRGLLALACAAPRFVPWRHSPASSPTPLTPSGCAWSFAAGHAVLLGTPQDAEDRPVAHFWIGYLSRVRRTTSST